MGLLWQRHQCLRGRKEQTTINVISGVKGEIEGETTELGRLVVYMGSKC